MFLNFKQLIKQKPSLISESKSDNKSDNKLSISHQSINNLKILIDAEREAKKIIDDAYIYRDNLRKRARAEAQIEIEKYRAIKEEEYQKKIAELDIDSYRTKIQSEFEIYKKNREEEYQKKVIEIEVEYELELSKLSGSESELESKLES
jgi:hypothetical protein